jgi:sarcosine oxidase
MPTFVDWTGPGIAGYAVPVAGVAPGVKVGDHGTGTPVDPAAGPFEVDGSRLSALADFVKRRLPGADPEPVAAEACLYTMTPDEDFVLDRIGNVVVGAGFSGHGFKFGPLIGELIAGLALGERTDLPERFSAARGALRSQV